MSQPIILIAPQRSGSTVLQRTLAAGGTVEAYGEVFHENKGQYAPNFFNFLQSNASAASLYVYPSIANMKRLFDNYMAFLSSLTDKPFFLVDAKENSLHHFNGIWADRFECPVFVRLCMDAALPIVRLKRRNVFLQVLSQDVVNASGTGHVSRNDAPPQVVITVNCFEYEQRIARFIREGRFIDRCLREHPKVVKLWYEDLFSASHINARYVRSISDLIGQAMDGSHELTYRKSIETPAEHVANAGEVIQYFRATPYRAMVERAFHGMQRR